jgi:hypothetical protein
VRNSSKLPSNNYKKIQLKEDPKTKKLIKIIVRNSSIWETTQKKQQKGSKKNYRKSYRNFANYVGIRERNWKNL